MSLFRVLSPVGSTGGVSIIELSPDPDRTLARLGLAPVATGEVKLRTLPGGDRGLIARWTSDAVLLMPHAGEMNLRRLLDALVRAGVQHRSHANPLSTYPEACDDVEARMLLALAQAPSPLAVDLLLLQPARWRGPGAASDPALDASRHRLLLPPLVLVLGPANIGKSTLVNALCRREVAIVSPEPGTTRDHVGALAIVDGLAVRLVDTPGTRHDPDPIERLAAELSDRLIPQADLLVLCGDAGASPPEPPASRAPAARVLRLGLRSDLGPTRSCVDLAVSLRVEPESAHDVARLVRRALLPVDALSDPRPWRFWAGEPT